MSLPLPAIDRLFDRFLLTYGAEFYRLWAGLDAAGVKAEWSAGLASYANHLQDLAWALENLPERCPNLIEFRNLCRMAPREKAPELPAPPADPARVAAELAKLGGVRAAKTAMPGVADGRAWAKRLRVREQQGDRLSPIQRRFLREALGVPQHAAA